MSQRCLIVHSQWENVEMLSRLPRLGTLSLDLQMGKTVVMHKTYFWATKHSKIASFVRVSWSGSKISFQPFGFDQEADGFYFECQVGTNWSLKLINCFYFMYLCARKWRLATWRIKVASFRQRQWQVSEQILSKSWRNAQKTCVISTAFIYANRMAVKVWP